MHISITEDIKLVEIVETYTGVPAPGPAALRFTTDRGEVTVWFNTYAELHDHLRAAMRDRDDGVLSAHLEAELEKEESRG